MNDIGRALALFEPFRPYAGYVPKGFQVDFLGTLTDANFRSMWGVDPEQTGGGYVTTRCPTVPDGEGFFEAADWFEAAMAARDSYTMVTLGACYGAQAIGAVRALQRLNPMPAKIVAVEADPGNFAWLTKHFCDNGIDPSQHWLVQCALSDTNKPVLFPIGAPGSGANNCHGISTPQFRASLADDLSGTPHPVEVIRNLLIDGDTGIDFDLAPGYGFFGRVKFVSAITLNDILGPLDRVDFLQSDIQQSEQDVFPPAMDMIKAKVKRVHIGTHGAFVHGLLLQELAVRRFEILYNYEPDTTHETPWGAFHTGDGIITAHNLDL